MMTRTFKACLSLLLTVTGLLKAVDLNPLYQCLKLNVDFNDSLGNPRRQQGEVTQEPNAFLGKGLKLQRNASCDYQTNVSLSQPDFTLWFFFNSNNVGDNPKALSLIGEKDVITFGFNPQNGYPWLKHTRAGQCLAELKTSLHVDGEAWRMITLRKKGKTCELLINAISYGHITLGTITDGKHMTLQLTSAVSKDIPDTVNRYDSITLYTTYLDDDILKQHFKDERHAHLNQKPLKTAPVPEPEHYVYEFDPTRRNNILRNGSFEFGSRGWHIHTPRDIRSLDRSIQTKTAPHGKRIFRFQDPKTILQHFPILARNHGNFHIAFAAKGTTPNSSLTFRIRLLNQFATPRKSFQKTIERLTDQFQNYSFPGTFLPNTDAFMIEFQATEGVELDAVQFGGQQEPNQHYEDVPNTIMVDMQEDYHVIFPRQKLNLRLYPEHTHPGGKLEIFDEKERLQCQMTINPGQNSITVPFERLGAFRAVVSCQGRPTDEITFARLFQPIQGPPASQSRYGAHFQNTPFMLEFAPLIGSRWNRNHDSAPYVARWKKNTKPMDNAFNYRFDVFELNEKNRQQLIATVTAPWKQEQSTPEEFGQNLARMIRDYKGKLKYVEIFNEPTAWFPPKRYAEFLKAAYKYAKQADPSVNVLGLSTWDVVAKFTQTVIENAGCDSMDIFAAHFYNWGAGAWLIPDGNWGQGVRMRKLRNYLNAKPGGKKLPIWHTESGIYMDSYFRHYPHRNIETGYSRARSYPHHTPRLGAIWMAQAFPVNFANGAAVFTYYAWGPTAGGIFRMNGHNLGEIDGSCKPSAAAFSASAHFLDYAQFIAGIDDLSPNGIRAFQFQRDGKNIVVAWTQQPQILTLKKRPELIYDYMGNKLTDADRPNRAFLNFNGIQREVNLTNEQRKHLFLDLEPKYFPNLTIDDFIALLPHNANTYSNLTK